MDELIDVHVTTTNSAENLVALFNFDVNSLLAELIDTFGFSEEHDFHRLLFWLIIQVISKSFINFVELVSNIDILRLHQYFTDIEELQNLVLSKFKFVLGQLELVEKIKLNSF